ncbi:hypothetical protein HUE56_07480 (plasmid) [Azospirillum oryzae]|uniref:Uncharacterized protein n=1 Tax=Azospirillum oryzae TaxID=286727 RepID=A0A6N1AGT3_9PROT|nr:hypothetical protein [Azospirillum oryzae]QKS50328.1 hypothetical protein HUE56_07480 [Azospirillum oryzae]
MGALVAGNSSIKSWSDIDKPGLRIARDAGHLARQGRDGDGAALGVMGNEEANR